ncbi:ABC transporter substrate-binding protein [Oceanitalea stevensii]|uniref:Sugar ABC transporter substrate-binding protein n=1 Tax=Oceanitalea stevensii TaxID=2763072 RepID=A0ABR8Z5R2_9MICO|nr:sugar ABC transporter substrate-binding protein [Oceanitalea stevensii]MBD8063343.1 sugar ABC transporter substrate-binding protein [Oceanitalea stevensii]
MVHRRTLVPALAVLVVGSLAACGSADDGEAATPDSPVDLRMTVWTADESQLALFDEIAADYVEANPDTVASVTFEALPFEDYTTTLTTQLAGGNAPDLAWIFESSAPEFVESGALTDIRPTLEGTEGYAYDDLLESATGLWSDGEGLYAYPFSNSPFVMFVNTDRIAESGQDDPADLLAAGEWSYDAARDISAASAEELGGAGMVVRDFDYAGWGNLATVWGGWDAAPWSEDGTQCTFTDPEMVEAMTWFHDAAFAQGAMPGPGTSSDFFAGDVTMTITQISRAASLDGSFEWDVVPLPAGPAGQQNVIGQAGIGVLANADNPEIAADFLAYFTSPESAEKLAAYFPPPRESLLTTEVLGDANPLLSPEQLETAVISSIVDAQVKPAHRNFAQLDTAVRGALDEMWNPGADVEAVLGNVCSAIEPLLEN